MMLRTLKSITREDTRNSIRETVCPEQDTLVLIVHVVLGVRRRSRPGRGELSDRLFYAGIMGASGVPRLGGT